MAVLVPNVPQWLTAEFLKSCLLSNGEIFQNIEITNHTIEPAVAPGNNYGSDLFRVKIEYENLGEGNKNNLISLIVKAPLTSAFAEEFNHLFEEVSRREPKFYNEFINETYKICEHDIVPKHFNSPNPRCVVLEDLCASGYIMPDRHKLLDFDHCKLYVKASAKLQALSVAVHETNPEIIEALVTVNLAMVDQMKQIMKGLLIGGLQCMAAYLEDKPDYKEYFDFMKEVISESDIICELFEEMDKSSKPLQALVQCDPWCTNMMFKYNSSGEVTNIKIFDFQSLKFASPVLNFITFVLASPNQEVKKTKLTDLFHLYCESLNDNLAKFGCSERLSFDELKAEILILSPAILMGVCMMVPLCLADGVGDLNAYVADISNPSIKERSMYTLYHGSSFNNHYPQLLDIVAKEGVFDYLKGIIKQRKQQQQ